MIHLKTRKFDKTQKGVLRGVRVLDLSRLVAGNMLSLQLGDFGADVIKIEPPSGDPLRAWKENDISFYWKTYSRNKKSVVLNLRDERQLNILFKMIENSNVFIENFRPGTIEAMGLAPESLFKINPNLIIVRISGFGQTGPYAMYPGFGTLVEAMSGFASRTGFPDREPVLPPLALADMITGVYGAFAVSTALLSIDRGMSKGQVIDLSLLEPMFSVLGPESSIFQHTGKIKKRVGNGSNTTAPRNVYQCSDGKYVALSGSTQNVAKRIFEIIGHPELITDKRFSTNTARVENRVVLDKYLSDWFRLHSRDDALNIMRSSGATVGPVYDISDIVQDKHFQTREIIVEVEDNDLGSMTMHNIVPRLSHTPGVWRYPAPELGEHTEEILREYGVSEEEITSIVNRNMG